MKDYLEDIIRDYCGIEKADIEKYYDCTVLFPPVPHRKDGYWLIINDHDDGAAYLTKSEVEAAKPSGVVICSVDTTNNGASNALKRVANNLKLWNYKSGTDYGCWEDYNDEEDKPEVDIILNDIDKSKLSALQMIERSNNSFTIVNASEAIYKMINNEDELPNCTNVGNLTFENFGASKHPISRFLKA